VVVGDGDGDEFTHRQSFVSMATKAEHARLSGATSSRFSIVAVAIDIAVKDHVNVNR